MRKNILSLQVTKYATATLLTGLNLLAFGGSFTPAQSTQQLFCKGRMNNGWNYTAEYLNGRFTQIRWERSGQPPQVSRLTFYRTNPQGEPVYRGSFQAATLVTLVDLSRGDVRRGSQISVGVEEWGWSRGTCGTSSGGGTSGTGSSVPIATVRRNLIGVNQVQARKWLRNNNFVFIRTVQHNNIRVIERWNQTDNRSQAIDVTITRGTVTKVVEAG
ncbi:hypothetical protein [Floridanema evergladense]|uniref:Uncharacterized protein n=1 Tax=Floridaenema evergladense BLCC-F167 TaxID=3153639 RepID=A0ABV4WW23_9CYAN